MDRCVRGKEGGMFVQGRYGCGILTVLLRVDGRWRSGLVIDAWLFYIVFNDSMLSLKMRMEVCVCMCV